jgi:hypothetical protein
MWNRLKYGFVLFYGVRGSNYSGALAWWIWLGKEDVSPVSIVMSGIEEITSCSVWITLISSGMTDDGMVHYHALLP